MRAATWRTWAPMSADFAALTAIVGKVGVTGVNSDFATLIRTVIIVGVLTVSVAVKL